MVSYLDCQRSPFLLFACRHLIFPFVHPIIIIITTTMLHPSHPSLTHSILVPGNPMKLSQEKKSDQGIKFPSHSHHATCA